MAIRGLVFGLWLTVILVWIPLALWISRDFSDALAWWAGVVTVLAGRASAEAIHRQRGV